MSVLIDCRFAHTKTGLGRFSRELVRALLRRNDSLEYRLLLAPGQHDWLQGHSPVVIETDIPHYSIAEQTALPFLLSRSGAAMLFSLHFNVPWLCPLPYVATVHDLILHHYPNDASVLKRSAYKLLMHRTVRRARHVLTISKFVQSELARAYGSSLLSKTSVIHEGVDAVFSPMSASIVQETLQRHAIVRPFFLYVGNAKQHKNVQLLIDAFERSGVADADLVLVTGGAEAERLHRSDRIRLLQGIGDVDLAALYTAARATVTASLYEGFCLPVLEALHCGCPVIASNRTAIPEVAGEHALLLEPTEEAFAEAFRNPPARVHVPAERATWERTAQETALVLSQTYRGLTGRS